MPTVPLQPADLRLAIDPATLDFADTRELVDEPLPWIGQARAEAAARFGLAMEAPDYNLFVLGETGSGRTSLLRQAMREMAAQRRVPPDLCYLYNFDAPERPLALRLPAGEGRLLRQSLAHDRHAVWKRPAKQRDPVEILEASNRGRLPGLVPIRYGRMLRSPFTFLRGSAGLMAHDLATTPSTKLRVQACGDCHLMNFGLFATP